MLRVGLTGGIASGKSTVAATLSRLGAETVDADCLVHTLLAPGGQAVAAVTERFGSFVLAVDGSIDRVTLGRIVFEDADARRALEGILHPLVRERAADRFEQAARERGCRIGVFDAALLVETGAYREYDRLIVVRCSVETQIRRLMRRDGMNEADARARIAAQASLEEKLAVADHVIDTEGSRESTAAQTEQVYRELERELS